jgi:hypothetical protein
MNTEQLANKAQIDAIKVAAKIRADQMATDAFALEMLADLLRDKHGMMGASIFLRRFAGDIKQLVGNVQ